MLLGTLKVPFTSEQAKTIFKVISLLMEEEGFQFSFDWPNSTKTKPAPSRGRPQRDIPNSAFEELAQGSSSIRSLARQFGIPAEVLRTAWRRHQEQTASHPRASSCFSEDETCCIGQATFSCSKPL